MTAWLSIAELRLVALYLATIASAAVLGFLAARSINRQQRRAAEVEAVQHIIDADKRREEAEALARTSEAQRQTLSAQGERSG
jgi:HAMP domain-containing protein